jgi:hypothetical protein
VANLGVESDQYGRRRFGSHRAGEQQDQAEPAEWHFFVLFFVIRLDVARAIRVVRCLPLRSLVLINVRVIRGAYLLRCKQYQIVRRLTSFRFPMVLSSVIPSGHSMVIPFDRKKMAATPLFCVV